MKKYFSLLALAISLTIPCVWFNPGISQEPGTSKVTTFMKLKLVPAKNLLESIAKSDFDSIQQNSERMRKLLLDENWMVHQTQLYRDHSKQFSKSLDLLHRAAKEHDIDTCLVAYMQMTMKCVQCHESIREAVARDNR